MHIFFSISCDNILQWIIFLSLWLYYFCINLYIYYKLYYIKIIGLFVTEVECEVSSQVEYSLQALWGVSIRELHLALWKPWSTLRDASLNGTLLQGHAQYLTPPQTYPFFLNINQFLFFFFFSIFLIWIYIFLS